jgi:hypothetical protein
MVNNTKHNSNSIKNKNAIKHGDGKADLSKPWQINRDITPEGNNSPWGAFLPREGKNRPTPHTKLNECDH